MPVDVFDVPTWMLVAVVALAFIDLALWRLYVDRPLVPNLFTGGLPPAFLFADEQPENRLSDTDSDTNE